MLRNRTQALFLLILFIGFSVQAVADSISVSGTVTPGGGKVALWQASQKIDETTADGSGNYSFSLSGPGTYEVIAYQSGYYPARHPLICTGAIVGLDLSLNSVPQVALTNNVMVIYGSLEVDHDADTTMEAAVPGDVITAIDPQGIVCGSFEVTTAGRYIMNIYGDDAATLLADEGAVSGDLITFHVNGLEAKPSTTWTTGQPVQLNLASGATGNTIYLKNGWNLISLGVSPISNTIETIFANVTGMKYVMGFFRSPADVGNEGFRTFMNTSAKEFSTLLTMDGYHGYWVYMTQDSTLEIAGSMIPEDHQHTVSNGWNLLGYWSREDGFLPTLETQVDTVIDSVFNNRAISGIAKYIMGFYRNPDDGGNDGFRTFMNNAAMSFSTLQKLNRGHGYWFYLQNAGVLKYGKDTYWSDKVLDHIGISPSLISLNKGSSYNLNNIAVTAYFTGDAQATAFNPTWTLGSGVGSVSSGSYTSQNAGNAVLTCTYTRDGVTKTAQIQVTVSETSTQSYTNLTTTTQAVRNYITLAEAGLALNNLAVALSNYQSAVNTDPTNVEANFGLALVSMVYLIENSNLQNIAYSMMGTTDYNTFPKTVNELISMSGGSHAPLFSPLDVVPRFLANPQLATSLTTVSQLQDAIKGIISALEAIDAKLAKALLDPNFSYSVGSAITGGQGSFTLGKEIPCGLLIYTSMLESMFSFLVSYNLDQNLSMSQEQGYDPFADSSYPNFGRLKTTDGAAYMLKAGQKMSDSIQYLTMLVGYADTNMDSLIQKYRLDEEKMNKMSTTNLISMLNAFRESFDYADKPVTATINIGTTLETSFSLSFYSFFHNPVDLRNYYLSLHDVSDPMNLPSGVDYSLNGLFKLNGLSPTAANILKYNGGMAYFNLAQLPYTSYRTITVDGSITDWSGVTPILSDPQDLPSSLAGCDIKAVYLAQNASYYYFGFEFYGPISWDDLDVSYSYKFVGSDEVGEGWWWNPQQNPDVIDDHHGTAFPQTTASSGSFVETRMAKVSGSKQLERFNIYAVETRKNVTSGTPAGHDYCELPVLFQFNGHSNFFVEGPSLNPDGPPFEWTNETYTGKGVMYDVSSEMQDLGLLTCEIGIQVQYHDTAETWINCTGVPGHSETSIVYDIGDPHRIRMFVWDYAADRKNNYTSIRLRGSMIDNSGNKIYGQWSYPGGEDNQITGSTYKVYGGQAPLSGTDGFHPENHGYTFLGAATETMTFSGNYPYYCIVTDPQNMVLVDSIQDSSGNYFPYNCSTYGSENWDNTMSPPDGNYATIGNYGQGGYICDQPQGSTTSITVTVVHW
ncbi:MAG: carboxypeptidase-like regulatory domain-containing protein [Candidatus Wallbacteria bacterium]|nr:carboxypeptidase-like regulatory domain-containing protein [Candidatus Wallbacteria bacterium]